MLDVRFPHTLQALLLDEQRDARESRPHVLGQGFDLCLDGLVKGFDRPAQMPIYQKRYTTNDMSGSVLGESAPADPALTRNSRLTGFQRFGSETMRLQNEKFDSIIRAESDQHEANIRRVVDLLLHKFAELDTLTASSRWGVKPKPRRVFESVPHGAIGAAASCARLGDPAIIGRELYPSNSTKFGAVSQSQPHNGKSRNGSG